MISKINDERSESKFISPEGKITMRRNRKARTNDIF